MVRILNCDAKDLVTGRITLMRAWSINKACKAHTTAHPNCAWCGRTDQPQAHHIIPVWKDESLAADPDNFVTLCGKRGCHRILGHNGDFARRYVENVVDVCSHKAVEKRVLSRDRPKEDPSPSFARQ